MIVSAIFILIFLWLSVLGYGRAGSVK